MKMIEISRIKQKVRIKKNKDFKFMLAMGLALTLGFGLAVIGCSEEDAPPTGPLAVGPTTETEDPITIDPDKPTVKISTDMTEVVNLFKTFAHDVTISASEGMEEDIILSLTLDSGSSTGDEDDYSWSGLNGEGQVVIEKGSKEKKITIEAFGNDKIKKTLVFNFAFEEPETGYSRKYEMDIPQLTFTLDPLFVPDPPPVPDPMDKTPTPTPTPTPPLVQPIAVQPTERSGLLGGSFEYKFLRGDSSEAVTIQLAVTRNAGSTLDSSGYSIDPAPNAGGIAALTFPIGTRAVTLTVTSSFNFDPAGNLDNFPSDLGDKSLVLDLRVTNDGFNLVNPQITANMKLDFEAILKGIDFSYYADPFVATGRSIKTKKGSEVAGSHDVRAHPGAAWPFGGIQMTPSNGMTSETQSGVSTDNRVSLPGTARRMYVYVPAYKGQIQAFGTSFVTGPGCQLGFDAPFMVYSGEKTAFLETSSPLQNIIHPYPIGNGAYTQRQHKNDLDYEYAEPGYYRVAYRSGTIDNTKVRAEMTVTQRTGIGKFEFHSEANKATIYLTTYTGSQRVWGPSEAGTYTRNSAANAVGLKTVSGVFCGNRTKNHIWHVFVFDRPFTLTTENNDPAKEARLIFDLSSGSKTVNMKVGKSDIGYDGAYNNILAENSVTTSGGEQEINWDFNGYRKAAYAKWNQLLSRLAVLDGGKNHRLEEKRIFYSMMYQTLLHPNIHNDTDGRYMGFDEDVHNLSDHKVGETPDGDPIYQKAQYQNYSGWDTYRGQMQILTLVDKQAASDMGQSLVNNAVQAGCTTVGKSAIDPKFAAIAESSCGKGIFTRWGYSNHETNVMNGEPGSILVGSLYGLGAHRLDAAEAFKRMLYGGIGTVIGDKRGFSPGISGNLHGEDRNKGQRDFFNPSSLPATNSNPKLLCPACGNNAFGPMSDYHEYAAADFTKAQFLNLAVQNGHQDAIEEVIRGFDAYDTGSDSEDDWSLKSDGNNKSAEDVYKEIMNLVGESWKKIYIPYTSQSATYTGGTHDLPRAGNKGSAAGVFKDVYHTARWREGEFDHYLFMVPFDIKGLFKKFGFESTADSDGRVSNTSMVNALHKFIHNNGASGNHYNSGEGGHFMNMGNQPSYVTPWALNGTGLPHYTQFTIRKIHNEMYDDRVNHGMAGNDDLGSLSAQYVWGAIGLYSSHYGTGVLHVVSPRFKRTIISTNQYGERKVLIDSRAEADTSGVNSSLFSNQYYIIKSMTLNNVDGVSPYDKTYIRYQKDIVDKSRGDKKGVLLKFTLTKHASGDLNSINTGDYNAIKGDTSYTWGRLPGSLPPSGSGGLDVSDYGISSHKIVDGDANDDNDVYVPVKAWPDPTITSGDNDSFGDFSYNHEYY